MEYTRVLKYGMSGDDVLYMKECLFSLGYYASKITQIKHNKFYKDTETAVKKYQKGNKDINGVQLEIDGKIGEKTWYAIERDFKAKFPNGSEDNTTGDTSDTNTGDNSTSDPIQAVAYTRLLKYKMSGDDVFYMKNCLFTLEYYTSNITKITNKTFGNDTVKAVKLYQRNNKDINCDSLEVDGIIGEKTWYAIERDFKNNKHYVKPVEPSGDPGDLTKEDFPNLDEKTIKSLNSAWTGISDTRKSLMKLCIAHAYDAVNGKYKSGDHLVGMYIIGANLYDKSLNLFHPTSSYIESRAKSRPDYFDGGRKDFMLEELALNPNIAASDCSGMIVGVMRKMKLVSSGFDTTANGLCGNSHSSEISKSELTPGDWVGKSGHIGMYIGADMVVEFAGGAYGCQITNLTKRKVRNLMNGRLSTMSSWTKYRKPKYYK